MSNQERANEMGRQHRVIHGATGRGEREAYSASSAAPSAGGFTVGTGRDARIDVKEAELEAPLSQGHGDSLCPCRAYAYECCPPPLHSSPRSWNWELFSLAGKGGGALCVCLPRIPQAPPYPPNPPSVRGVVRSIIAGDPSKSLSPSFLKYPNLERIL